ncbi:MAG: hypothetical protein R3237_05995 [Nitrosopumilaceae archaeon]|nr:hypothetical protein [Nitrosopumilaceae archaeon]
MTSLLDDANRMLQSGLGDLERLKKIKAELEQNKMLVVSEREYLVKLAQDNPKNPHTKTSNYGRDDIHYSTNADLEVEELEEKIRVDSEPS